jgi:hypothetical protein
MQARTLTLAAGVAALCMMAACNGAKSPEAASRDIQAADRAAAREVSEARHAQEKDMSTDAYEVAVAQADGDRKIAIQKCETLQGHDQRLCKDQADADYEAARAIAKATRVSRNP